MLHYPQLGGRDALIGRLRDTCAGFHNIDTALHCTNCNWHITRTTFGDLSIAFKEYTHTHTLSAIYESGVKLLFSSGASCLKAM